MDSLLPRAERLGALLRARGETLAVSESSSGGLVAAALLAVPGASAFVLGGAVAYTPQAREALLGIGAAEMAGLRSASEPYAALMARTVRARLGADWGLAETGAAGPRGNRYGDPAGHSCLAVSGPGGGAVAATLATIRVATLATGRDDRAANMRAFAAGLLDLALSAVEAAPRRGA